MDKALLVGINEYPDPNQLHGCVNDVMDMANFLVSHCQFAHDDVRLLTDHRATAKNIRTRLSWLLKGIGKGDRILFHYSGHGAQVATRDRQGETDKYDEVICPVNFDFDDEETMIRDKEFVKLFGDVPEGVEFVWISDSCFSGGLTRGMMRMPDKVKTWRVKTMALPEDIVWRNQSAETKGIKPLTMKGAAKELNVALISGCTETQESADAEIDGRFNGALTYFLLQELNTTNGLKKRLSDVVKDASHKLGLMHYEQKPELLGSKEIGAKPFMEV